MIPTTTPTLENRKFEECPAGSGKVSVRTKVCSSESDPVYVMVVDPAIVGVGIYWDTQVASTPGTEQTLLSITVPASTVYSLRNLYVVSRFQAEWTLELNSVVVASGRTGASKPKDHFDWIPQRPAVATDTIELKITVRSGIPSTTIGAHLQASSTTV